MATPPHNGMGEEGLDLYNEVINIMRSGISGVSTSTYLHQAAHAGLPPGRSGSGRAIREAAERTKAAPPEIRERGLMGDDLSRFRLASRLLHQFDRLKYAGKTCPLSSVSNSV